MPEPPDYSPPPQNRDVSRKAPKREPRPARPLAPRPMRLAYMRDEGLNLFVYCNRCFRNRIMPAAPLIKRLGADTAVPNVARHIRCRVCGGRDVETRPDWTSDSPGVISRHGGAD